MKTQLEKRLTKEKKQEILMYITAGLMATLLVAAVYFFVPTVMAAPPTPVEQIFGIVGNVLRAIACIVGGILVLAGIFKYTTAHANENGPDQQKGIMLIATGIVLIILFTVIVNNTVIGNLAQLVDNNAQPPRTP